MPAALMLPDGTLIGTAAEPMRVDTTNTTTQVVAVAGTVDVTPTAPVATDYLPVRLTDGSAFYSASGGGGGNSDEATFVLTATDIATANNKSMISLLNGASSAVLVKLREIWISNVRTAAATGVITQLQLLRCTGQTSGTALTPLAYDTNDTLDSNVIAATGATISGEASAALNRWLMSTDEWAVGTVDNEANDSLNARYHPVYRYYSPMKPITLRPGQGLHIKNVVNTTTGIFDLSFVFTTV